MQLVNIESACEPIILKNAFLKDNQSSNLPLNVGKVASGNLIRFLLAVADSTLLTWDSLLDVFDASSGFITSSILPARE